MRGRAHDRSTITRRHAGSATSASSTATSNLPEAQFRKQLAEQYEEFKPLMAKPDFPGDRDRVKAFFEDKDFEEK